MPSQRLERLYKQPLMRPEDSKKTLPLEHILKKEIVCFPRTPVDWQFDVVEIGPGNGDFVCHLAKHNLDKRFLGLEIGNLRYQRLCKRLERDNILNVTIVHGDARIAMYQYIPDHTIKRCFVLFPDPWPKNRHAKTSS